MNGRTTGMDALVLWVIAGVILFVAITVFIFWVSNWRSDRLDMQKVRAMNDEKAILKVGDRIQYKDSDGNNIIYAYIVTQESQFKGAPKVVIERCYVNKLHHRTRTIREGGDIERAMEGRVKVLGDIRHKILRNWKQTRTLAIKE